MGPDYLPTLKSQGSAHPYERGDPVGRSLMRISVQRSLKSAARLGNGRHLLTLIDFVRKRNARRRNEASLN